MNHFIAGILKIALLEGSIALILIDLVAGERFEKARARAHAVLTGTMVLAWCNYGALHPSNDPAMLLTCVPLVWLCGRAISFAFDPKRDERWAALKAAASANPARVEQFTWLFGLIAVAMIFTWLGNVPGGSLILGLGAVIVAGRIAKSIARGERKALIAPAEALVKRAKVAAIVLVVVVSGGWVTGGVLSGRALLVHQWEQFHFYLGAKYQREVGWMNLYKAVILADRETVQTLAQLKTTRDLATFETIDVDAALAHPEEIRGRFSPERWEEFKADWVRMSNLWRIDWTRIINDHGNSNSPAWSIIAGPLTRMVPLTMAGQAFLGWLDLLLMLGLWLAIWQTFGHRVASVGLFIWAAPPIIFEYSTGSILRWDWLFTIGLAACFLKQKRYGWAGGFFGFAVATKLFPLFFGVAMGLRAALEWRTTRVIKPEHKRFAVATIGSGLVTVLLSTAMFGTSSWVEYAQRIQVAQLEKFYAIQYSFKTLWLQHAAGTPAEWAQTIFPGSLKQQQANVETCRGSVDTSSGNTCSRGLTKCGDDKSFIVECTGDDCVCKGFGKEERFTEANACSRMSDLYRDRCHFPDDYSFSLLVAQLLFSLVILVLIRRADDVEAFLLGPLLVFTWLTVNMYYWNMLGLLVVGLMMRSERPGQKPVLALTFGVHLAFMVFYLYQHLNRSLTEAYAVTWIFAVSIIVAAAIEWFAARKADAVTAASPPSAR
ncbi:MAG: glycosyltransferase family 87 protein [Myxococcaceae bacterium]